MDVWDIICIKLSFSRSFSEMILTLTDGSGENVPLKQRHGKHPHPSCNVNCQSKTHKLRETKHKPCLVYEYLTF